MWTGLVTSFGQWDTSKQRVKKHLNVGESLSVSLKLYHVDNQADLLEDKKPCSKRVQLIQMCQPRPLKELSWEQSTWIIPEGCQAEHNPNYWLNDFWAKKNGCCLNKLSGRVVCYMANANWSCVREKSMKWMVLIF